MEKNYDIIIVGAGPAGLFATYELANNTNFKILCIDKGKSPLNRNRTSDIMCGVGGAGCMSDGKLNLNPYIGGDLTQIVGNENEANNLISYVDQIFLNFGAKKEKLLLEEKAILLQEKAVQAGIKYIPVKQRHIGSDKLPTLIDKILKNTQKNKAEFALQTEIDSILVKNSQAQGVLCTNGTKYYSNHILLAPGRSGNQWFNKILKEFNHPIIYNPIDVGVRIETLNQVYRNLTDINYDPKIHIYTKKHHDFVRTFCTNPSGFVTTEQYEGFVGVNGHAEKKRKSSNTNFALLTKVHLTSPQENTREYGESIAKLATTLGGGKVLLQTLSDLKDGRRSTEKRINKSFVNPTLQNYTPGDITMALPGRIIDDILEAIEKLDTIVPGLNAGSNTLLYAPEIKYHKCRQRENHPCCQ